jgi:hypothetical protein
MLEKATNPGSEQDLPAATQYGIGVKPECTVPEDYNLPDAFRPMMDEQRSIQRQRPTEDRIYIGGEIIVHHLVKAGCSTFSMGPFEDFVDDMKAIYSRFGSVGNAPSNGCQIGVESSRSGSIPFNIPLPFVEHILQMSQRTSHRVTGVKK